MNTGTVRGQDADDSSVRLHAALLQIAASSHDGAVAIHARATELPPENSETGFDAAIDEAKRVVALDPD